MAKKDKKTIKSMKEHNAQVRMGNSVPSYMLHETREGSYFFFGTKCHSVVKKHTLGIDERLDSMFVGKPQDKDGHILVLGGAGSGKSSCIVMPTLESWNGPIFAIDIKGELIDHWSRLDKKNSHRSTKILSFSKKYEGSSSYDPFRLLHQCEENTVLEDDFILYAREIAEALIPLPIDTADPFWIRSAQNVLTAAIITCCKLGLSFNHVMTLIQTRSIGDLLEYIKENNVLSAKLMIKQFSDIENPNENKMLTSIGAELSSRTAAFALDMRIKDLFQAHDNAVSWDDLESYNIFLHVDEDKLSQWSGAISMMITQLVRTLERRPEKDSKFAKENEPILLLLDEFPRLGKINIIENAVSTLRSKGVTICLIMQSLSQLDNIYGSYSRQTIVDTCAYKAVLSIADPGNQKIISDMVGSMSSLEKTYNLTAKEDEIIGIHYSGQDKPIIEPSQLATLEDIVLLTPEGFCRVDKAPSYQRDGFVIQSPIIKPRNVIGYIPRKDELEVKQRSDDTFRRKTQFSSDHPTV